jgi:hypothetical protein
MMRRWEQVRLIQKKVSQDYRRAGLEKKKQKHHPDSSLASSSSAAVVVAAVATEISAFVGQR